MAGRAAACDSEIGELSNGPVLITGQRYARSSPGRSSVSTPGRSFHPSIFSLRRSAFTFGSSIVVGPQPIPREVMLPEDEPAEPEALAEEK